MPVSFQRPSSLDVSQINPNSVIYVQGQDGTDESWRFSVPTAIDKLSIEHFEPLTESNITLDEAKVITVGAVGYTPANKYFASVTTDSRADNTTPSGISGDMTGLFIEFDGTLWLNFTDQWVEKGSFVDSLIVDRMLARRTILLNTDPDDASIHLPTPDEGTSLGSRNTAADGSGTETIAFNDRNGHFGHLVEMLHNSSLELLNQMHGIKADDTLIGVPYELGWVENTYAVGDIIIDAGLRYKCNTAGAQSTSFATNSSLWDAIDYTDIFDVDTVVTDGGAVVVNQGNVVVV